MPRREPLPPKDFAFDFTADWSGVAAIPNGSDASLGWTLHGTVRKHGQTYGLAYRHGMYAACTLYGQVFNLTAIERIDRQRVYLSRIVLLGVFALMGLAPFTFH